MPEYLSPGVFIEEIPARLKAIEGVSTSTAGFVGPAERGPVAGLSLPFNATKEFGLSIDLAPVLVTSFSQFMRTFGKPLPLPAPGNDHDSGFLAYSVKAFFDNGGKRCYISRVVKRPENTHELFAQARVAQGLIVRLASPGKKDDQSLTLTSLRGVSKGQKLKLFKLADGASALNGGRAIVPYLPVLPPATEIREPFQLAIGDAFAVKVGTDPSVTSAAIVATAAVVEGANGPFSTAANDTLTVAVDQRSQTVVFPEINNGTVEELSALLNRELKDVQVFVSSGGKLTLRSDRQGSEASLEIVSGEAAAKLGLEDLPGTPKSAKGTGNVKDADRVTIDDIRNLFSPAPTTFEIQRNGAERLQILSIAAGADVKIQAEDAVVGTLAKLGLSTSVATGTAPTELTIDGYDAARNRVTLVEKLAENLAPDSVFGTLQDIAVSTNAGPRFFARNPGAWGTDLRVSINHTERRPIPIVQTAAAGSDNVQLQSTTGLYVGAIVEIDGGPDQGFAREQQVIKGIEGNLVSLLSPLTHSLSSGPQGSSLRLLEIDITISDVSGSAAAEVFTGLTWNTDNLRKHYANQINARSKLVYVQPPGVDGLGGSESPTLANQPVTANGLAVALNPPADTTSGLPEAGTAGDPVYIGNDDGPGRRTGIHSLKDMDDIRIIAAPGATSAAVQNELITQCALLRYRFAVLDSPRPDQDGSVTSILNHRSLYDTSYAAYYAPWVAVANGNAMDYLPPSGFIAGIFARTDNERGVHKAPANEVVRNCVGLQSYFTTGEQDILNPRGVNAIRRFDGRGIRVWGARTLSSDPEFRYVNVRRFMIFLEASIDRGTQYVVFEPNSPPTWSRVVDSISAFLNTQWRSGALFGRRPEDAYYVRCDESTMTVDDIQNGRLICDIGVAIVRPAEFVIFRIEQITGFANNS